ncbi:MAG TPA: hypothetical protein VNK41_01555 [Vicinamibacterales bacterium]|nr:hypothetical protein [Vicinamibacterales bacterium]
MTEHHPHHRNDEPLPDPVAVGHETSDAQAGPIVKFLILLAVTCLAVAGLMVVFHNYLERREASEKVSRYPVAAGRERPLPPPPRLQTEPFGDIKELRRAERRLLDRYEWVDRNAGTVRIPIDRAMEILAERGLPHRAETPATAEASSGGSGAATKPAPQR